MLRYRPVVNKELLDWEKVKVLFGKEKDGLLKTLSKEKRRYPAISEVLKILAGGVLLSEERKEPPSSHILRPMVWTGAGYQAKRLNQVVKRLVKQGLVNRLDVEGYKVLKISEKGMAWALKYKLQEFESKAKKWDGKWRVVAFDVPMEMRKAGNMLRKKLKAMGFVPVQKSLYAGKTGSKEEFDFIAQILGLKNHLTFFLAEKLSSPKLGK